MASLAGAWIALVAGFGGLRDDEGVLAMDPMLPEGIRRLRFRLIWHGVRLLVDVDHQQVTYAIRDGSDAQLTLRHAGKEMLVTTSQPLAVPLQRRTPSRPTPTQPLGRAPVTRSPLERD